MTGNFQVRTDLALEARESYGEKDIRIRGVKIQEESDAEREIYTTVVKIEMRMARRQWENRWAPILRWRPPICLHRMRITTGRYLRRWPIICGS